MQTHLKVAFGKLILFALAVSACRPAPKEPATPANPPDSTTLKQMADSGSFYGQDGLDYEPLHTGTFEQLPAELSTVLNTHYPGWSLPNIAKEYLTETERNHTGPYYLQADFNGDSILDFAVQYFLKDTIYVKAYLQGPTKKLQEYALNHFAYKRVAPQEESKLYLSLLAQGKEILTGTGPEKIKLPQPAIAVSNNPQGFVYYFDGQQFRALSWQPEPEN